MRRLLRRLAAIAGAPHPGAAAPDGRQPSFPIIDGGALACPDLAASLAALAHVWRNPNA